MSREHCRLLMALLMALPSVTEMQHMLSVRVLTGVVHRPLQLFH